MASCASGTSVAAAGSFGFHWRSDGPAERPVAHVVLAGLADPEARIARVTAWVLQADRLGLRWGLRLPGGATIAPGEGAQHRRRCLEALALC